MNNGPIDQGNMRLHVDLFIKYVSNNGQFYIDITNNWQRKLLIKLKSLYSPRFSLEVHTQLASTEGPVYVCTSMSPFVNKNSRPVRVWDIFPRLLSF